MSNPQAYFSSVVDNYFNNINFESKELYNSSFLIDRISDYIFYLNYSAEPALQQKLFSESIAKVMSKVKDVKFKSGKGFEVYSVSLDRNKTDWTKAIAADGLVWENHVSDLKFWQSAAAATYNVNAIPATFLVDADGVIIAKNLRGAALENTLSKLAK